MNRVKILNTIFLKKQSLRQPYGNPTATLRNCGLLTHKKNGIPAEVQRITSKCSWGASLPLGTSVTLRQPYGNPTAMAGHPLQNVQLAGQPAWYDLWPNVK